MKLIAILLAFTDEPIERCIEIPDEQTRTVNEILNLAYNYGQNDIRPRDNCFSVSAGDVILYQNQHYLVLKYGFCELQVNDYEEYKNAGREIRRQLLFSYQLSKFP